MEKVKEELIIKTLEKGQIKSKKDMLDKILLLWFDIATKKGFCNDDLDANNG